MERGVVLPEGQATPEGILDRPLSPWERRHESLRHSDNDMSGQYRESFFGETAECPDAGMERGVVLPEGHAARESIFDRPLSPMAAVFGLLGTPS